MSKPNLNQKAKIPYRTEFDFLEKANARRRNHFSLDSRFSRALFKVTFDNEKEDKSPAYLDNFIQTVQVAYARNSGRNSKTPAIS